MQEPIPYYIGVKRIQALPAFKNGAPGYRVIYSDGYVSWSPKDIFEKSYLRLSCPAGDQITQQDVDNFTRTVAPAQQYGEQTAILQTTDLTGFERTESSACVDPANFDLAIDAQYAKKKIDAGIWQNLGFVLRWAIAGLSK